MKWSFREWKDQLDSIARSKGFNSAGSDDLWMSAWRKGLSPQQAWDSA